mgnify:CR=1 FL=1
MNATAPRALAAYFVAYLVFLYLPMALIPLFSFNDAVQAAFPLKGFTLGWYASLAGNASLKAAVVNSLLVGSISAVIATATGFAIAYAATRGRTRLARPIALLARLPILMPGVVLGIALLILANLIGLGPSLTAVVAGHVVFCLPISVVVLSAQLKALPRSLEEAAMDLGAREWTTLRRVVLPLAAPAVLSSLMLTFITSFDEFIVAFFLTGTDITLPIYIWSQLRFPKSLPSVMALGTLILATSVVVVALAEWLRRRSAVAGAEDA